MSITYEKPLQLLSQRQCCLHSSNDMPSILGLEITNSVCFVLAVMIQFPTGVPHGDEGGGCGGGGRGGGGRGAGFTVACARVSSTRTSAPSSLLFFCQKCPCAVCGSSVPQTGIKYTSSTLRGIERQSYAIIVATAMFLAFFWYKPVDAANRNLSAASVAGAALGGAHLARPEAVRIAGAHATGVGTRRKNPFFGYIRA